MERKKRVGGGGVEEVIIILARASISRSSEFKVHNVLRHQTFRVYGVFVWFILWQMETGAAQLSFYQCIGACQMWFFLATNPGHAFLATNPGHAFLATNPS